MKNNIQNGDLVEVVFLPETMLHFTVGVGIVCRKSDKGDFFIQWRSKNGKFGKDNYCGWYKPENVKVLIKGFKRGVLDGKPVYRQVPGKTRILREATKRTDILAKEYAKKSADRWAKFLGGNK